MAGLSPKDLDAILAEVIGERAAARMSRRMRARLVRTILDAANDVAEQIGASGTVLESSAIVDAYMAQHLPRVMDLTVRNRRILRRIIGDSIRNGEPVSAQVKQMRQVFRNWSGKRLTTIARTENGIAWGMGGRQQMVDMEVLGRLWVTSRDTRVRHSHQIDGQCRPLNEPYQLRDSVAIMYPHDPSAPVKEIVQCRCVEAPFPRGCSGRGALAHEGRRTRYWRRVMALQRGAERELRRAVRIEFSRQAGELAAAFKEAA